MHPKRVGTFLCALGLAVAFMALPTSVQAQGGTVSGVVTDQDTGGPLQGARIFLVGTNRSTVSNDEGRYVLRNVPAGEATVQVVMIGFRSFARTFRMAEGGAATADFDLPAVVLSMDAIVVTATGEQRAREVANAISRIDVGQTAEEVMPVSMASMIQGRAPGVQMINSSGTAGSSTKIRIRGSSSVSLGNNPLIVVDGIRVENGENSIGFNVGGQTVNRINDFNPDEIESIEIVKGPSASALYGTAAANGVIVIRTRRGRVGRPVWSAYVEQGIVQEISDFPNNYRGLDATGSSCRISNIGAGTCTQTELQIANPLESETVSPITDGSRQQYGLQVQGGSEEVQYFVSGEWETENGIFTLPQGTQDSIIAAGGVIPDRVLNPNRVERASIRANMQARIGENANLRMSTGFVSSDVWLPQNDNNVLGMLPSGLLGGTDSTVDGGWRFFAPEEIFFIEGKQAVDRFTGSGDLSWRPTYWLEGHATAGLDFTERRDIRFQATGTGPNFATRFQGDRISDSRTIYQYTLDVGATAQFQLSPTVSSKTTVAGQYFRTNVEQIETTGQILAPGAGSQKSASTQFIDEDFIESRTLGFFIEEALGFNERFFINGALRFDDNSAFGEEFDGTIYPKAGVSWVAQEGGGGGFLDNLRLRGAFGASGQQPGSNDATQFFTGISVIDDAGEQSGVRISNAGNANLKPERSTEVEVGFDAGLFANRVGLEFTYYNRTTTDALIERTLAPSIGLTTSVLDNIGETNNKGIELGLNMVLFDSPSFSWDMSISGSTNSNEIVTLGCQVDVDPCPAGSEIEPIIIGSQNQHRKGRPLGAWFDESFTFDDLDGDGIIEQNEITYSDTNEFIGYPRPRYEISFFNAINFGERLRVSGLFDYRGGHKQFNLTEAFRCGFNICQWINDPSSTLAEQAAAQTRRGGPGTGAAFIEDAWFIKLRELSFTFFFPQGFAEGLGMDRMNLTVTGRNLLTITDYLGADPEVQGQTGNFTGRDFLTQPQVRYWTARLNLTF